MKKKLCMLLSLICVFFMMTGCEQKENKKEGIQVYYLNMERTGLLSESYRTNTQEPVALANELLVRLQSEPESGDLCQTLSDKITVKGCLFNGNYLVVDFSADYKEMSVTEEVLTRAAIVKTLLQVDTITSVSFTVESEPLCTSDGVEVGIMNYDSFVENPGAQINSSVHTTLTLYFASSDGTYLKKETRSVHYSSNISLDKLVVEQLIEGPKTSGLQATIPSATRLVTISTVDGVCYVNLDEAFRNQNAEITEDVVLYSLVNSLTQLSDVEKVQISVNGDTSGKCRYELELSNMYEANSDMLKSKTKNTDKNNDKNSKKNTDKNSDKNATTNSDKSGNKDSDNSSGVNDESSSAEVPSEAQKLKSDA